MVTCNYLQEEVHAPPDDGVGLSREAQVTEGAQRAACVGCEVRDAPGVELIQLEKKQGVEVVRRMQMAAVTSGAGSVPGPASVSPLWAQGVGA